MFSSKIFFYFNIWYENGSYVLSLALIRNNNKLVWFSFFQSDHLSPSSSVSLLHQTIVAETVQSTRCRFQVAERSLFLWNNDHIMNLIAHNRHVILPIILPALERNAQSHWNQAVVNLTLNVRKIFMEMDDELFISCHAHCKEEEAKETLVAKKRKQIWEQLENSAGSVQPMAGKTAVLVTPFASSIAC